MGASPYPQSENDGVGRTGKATQRPAGQVDVEHAGRPRDIPFAQRRIGSFEAATDGDPGCRRQARSDSGGRRDREAAWHLDGSDNPRHRIWSLSRRAV